MKTAKCFLLTGFFVFTFLVAFSQTNSDSTAVVIETIDGNKFTGKIVGEDAQKLIINVESLGEITVGKSNIKSRTVIPADQLINNKWWFPNPQSSRYFWAPNGYGLKKGEGYYQNIWVLWNQFAYGLTSNFSIGATVIPLFLFGGTSTPVFINPKFSVPFARDKFNVGAGALLGTVIGEGESGFGIVYGVSTFGSSDRNISLGLGYGYAAGEWTSTPVINISGMARISPRWYLLSENHFVVIEGEGGGFVSAGARWIIKRAALDFGLFVPAGTDIDTFVAVPWLGFTVPFGNVD